MRMVIQRVGRASVTVAGREISSIGGGLLVLLGIEERDTLQDVEWCTAKLVRLRIFSDGEGRMNRDVVEAGGDILVVSQFTLFASTKKGNRPSFIRAARPEQAIPLYQAFVEQAKGLLGRPVRTGEFGAMMDVSLSNDGPVTILVDSHERE